MRPLITGNFLEDTLNTPGGINSAVTSCAMVGSTFGSPTYRVVLAFDPDTAAHELIRCTVAGSSITQMERGFDGTTAQSHTQTAVVRMVNPARYLNDTYTFMEDGWVPVPDYVAATYASATSFTLAGDWTAVLSKGDAMRLTNSSTKYGAVASVSFASTVTTVTLITNTDYTLAAGAVSNVYYSKAASPSGYPGWFNFSYAPTGFSSQPTGVTAKWKASGNTLTLAVNETGDGTSNATSHSYAAPVASAAGMAPVSAYTGSRDNGANVTGKHLIGAATSTVSTFPAPTGSWTATGAARLASDGVLLSYQF